MEHIINNTVQNASLTEYSRVNGSLLVLASGSPRRIEMFHEHVLDPMILPSDAEERIPDFLSPAEVTMFLSLLKAQDVAGKLEKSKPETASVQDITDQPRIIVGSDTVVVFENTILGKPQDEEDAYRMLSAMSGKKHQVITGVAIAALPGGSPLNSATPAGSPISGRNINCFYEISDVWFHDIPEDELRAYVQTDEPYDKAGAYAIQETFAKYTKKITGDINTIIGFPWDRFEKEMAKMGFALK